MISQQRLMELLIYNPSTGDFMGKNGLKVGIPHNRGYVLIRVDGARYLAHRLAWLYMTGRWPTHEIDRANGVKNDNAFANLREATRSQNCMNRSVQRNNSIGLKGVTKRTQKKLSKPYIAHIKVDKRRIYLGYFATAEEAFNAYCAAAQAHHGSFMRT